MRALVKYMAIRSVNILLVLLVTLVISIISLGPMMDRIILDSVRIRAVDMAIGVDSEKPFKNNQERQQYIDLQIKSEIKALGLDEPWYSPKKFGNTIFKLLVLDLGRAKSITSDSGSSNVRDIIIEKLPKTALLFTTANIIIFVLGIYAGAYAAYKSGSIFDKIHYGFAIVSNSVPSWWIGILMLILFVYILGLFPARLTPDILPSDSRYLGTLLYNMMLPLLTIVGFGYASWALLVRYYIINVLKEDFISAKKSAGIPSRRIIYSHGLKNAAPPILNHIVSILTISFAGSILLEAVFDWPGMGQLYMDAIARSDFAIIIGLTYISALIFVIAVFAIDMLYTLFDPRVKVG